MNQKIKIGKNSAEPKTLTFEQWIAKNPEALEAERECSECDGEGVAVCPFCVFKGRCKKCNGIGVIDSAHEAYERIKRLELAKWQWLKR